MNTHEKEISKKFTEYEKWLFGYAESVFTSKILPYLKKYRLNFLAGNGSWWIFPTEDTPEWFIRKYKSPNYSENLDRDALGIRIRAILESEVEGCPSNDLGSLMPDYVSD